MALAVLAACVALGCGDDSPPSKFEFADRADEICTDIGERVTKLNQGRPKTISDLATYVKNLEKVVREKLARLQALERPEGADGVTAKRFTDTLAGEYRQEVLPSLGALERAIPKSDNEAIKRARRQLTRAQRNKRSSRFAAQLGASQCVIASGFGGQSSPVPVGP